MGFSSVDALVNTTTKTVSTYRLPELLLTEALEGIEKWENAVCVGGTLR